MKTKTKLNPIVQALLSLEAAGSLQHQVELAPLFALEFAQHAEPHGVDTATLVGFIETVNGTVPPMKFASGNPNNGSSHHKFSIGKEYKRVVYVNIVTCYFSGAGVGDKPEGEAARKVKALIDELTSVGELYGAKEITTEEDELSFSIRFWWKD